MGEAAVRKVSVQAYEVPTESAESDGTLQWDRTTLVVVEAQAGNALGIGYTYADRATAELIHSKLVPEVLGIDAFDTRAAWDKMVRSIRNLGGPGISAMAISAVDSALWDLKARLLGIPLYRLIGAAREFVPVYGSGGFTSYSIAELQKQLGGWVEQGIGRVKMKVGTEPASDPERVARAREVIGAKTELFVDANGAYSRRQALELAESFAGLGVRWFEEPVSSDDLEGLSWIRSRAPSGVEIAAGEYGYRSIYFLRMLEAGAVDVLQADASRCCGITGFLQALTLAEAHQIPLSAHCAPMLHMHLGCASNHIRHVEYFHDHARIEGAFFDGFIAPKRGALHPDRYAPGNGLTLKKADAARFAA